jgi:acyl carrier protein
MKTEAEIKQALREWIAATSGKIEARRLTDGTPIIEQRIVSSLQVMDLILFLERLSNRPVEIDRLKPGVFRDINSIYSGFFQAEGAG